MLKVIFGLREGPRPYFWTYAHPSMVCYSILGPAREVLCPSPHEPIVEFLESNLDIDTTLRLFGQNGKISGTIDALRLFLNKSPHPLLVLGMTVAEPLINADLLDNGGINPLIYFHGHSGMGKSMTALLGASLNGNPQMLKLGVSTSPIGYSQFSRLYGGIPIYLDELSRYPQEKVRELLAHILDDCTGVKGTPNGIPRIEFPIESTVFAMGEKAIEEIVPHTMEGMTSRVIQVGLERRIFTDDKEAEHAKKLLLENYGHLALFAMQYVIDEIYRLNNTAWIREIQEDYKNWIISLADTIGIQWDTNVGNRYISILSAAYAGCHLFEMAHRAAFSKRPFFFKKSRTTGLFLYYGHRELALMVLSEAQRTINRHSPERAFGGLLSDLARLKIGISIYKGADPIVLPDKNDVIGKVDLEPWVNKDQVICVYFTKQGLEAYLFQNGYNPKLIIECWKDEHRIGEGLRNVNSGSQGGKGRRPCYVLRLERGEAERLRDSIHLTLNAKKR